MGDRVETQNYIDDTGVQVPTSSLRSVTSRGRRSPKSTSCRKQPRFDYICWDVYSRVRDAFRGHPDQ